MFVLTAFPILSINEPQLYSPATDWKLWHICFIIKSSVTLSFQHPTDCPWDILLFQLRLLACSSTLKHCQWFSDVHCVLIFFLRGAGYKCIDHSLTVFLSLSFSDLLSLPQVVPAVPGWCVTKKAAVQSSAITANRLGIRTRRVTRLASRGRNPCTPTATIHPATHKNRDQVSVWKPFTVQHRHAAPVNPESI